MSDKPDIAMSRLLKTFEDAYRDACLRDPGLEEAIRVARLKSPNIGWLDVASKREREAAVKAP